MKNGYSICLNEWALDKEIKNELSLLLIISSLTAEKGYCYASNEYLSELFQMPSNSISIKIKKLESKGYIKCIYQKRGCEIISREIRLSKFQIDDIRKFKSTILENSKENNTSINNINNMNIIYNWNDDKFCDCNTNKNKKCQRRSTYCINGKNYCNQHSKTVLVKTLNTMIDKVNTTDNNTVVIKRREYETEFEEVWKEYPKHQGKSNSLKAYIKARLSGVTKETILNGVKNYKEYIKQDNKEMQYVKNGSTWFNQNCWDDEYNIQPKKEQPERIYFN